MKKTLLAVTLAALTSGAATTALAADPKAPEPEFTLSANVALVSDYRFRGLSQTNRKPALQGGFDYEHKSGFYAGNWNSSISWVTGSSGLESDFYVGYATEAAGVGIDVGNIYYYYAGSNIDSLVPTNEVYLGLSYGPLNFKTSYTTSKGYFSFEGRGTVYYNLAAEVPISETVSLTAAYGYTAGTKDVAAYKGSDYLVGVAVDMGDGWSLGLSWVGSAGNYKTFNGPGNGDSRAMVSISRSL
jgi:uncharacterized protein (TIGR02001 family)